MVEHEAQQSLTPITIRLKETWIDQLTGLALVDESRAMGDQMRRAVTTYLEQPPEADKRFQLRQVTPVDRTEPLRAVSVGIPIEELRLLGGLAATYAVAPVVHIRAALNGYLIQRLSESALPELIDHAIERVMTTSP